jgi:hypothetical protein
LTRKTCSTTTLRSAFVSVAYRVWYRSALYAILVPMEHDASYKLLFAHARMVEDLLRGFVHEAWVRDVDWTTLERVSDSQISDDLRSRRDDLVWRVR